MQQELAEIFYDNGVVFLAYPQNPLSLMPYWKTFMAIGHAIADGGELRVDENEDGNWAFFDKDGTLLGIQMQDPVDKESGAPKEAALEWPRAVMEEHQVVMFVEAMKDCHAQNAEEGHDGWPDDGPEVTLTGGVPAFMIDDGQAE